MDVPVMISLTARRMCRMRITRPKTQLFLRKVKYANDSERVRILNAAKIKALVLVAIKVL